MDIIRFKQHGKNIVLFRNVTLEQAQEWCSSPNTKGKTFFDGMAHNGSHCPNQKPKYGKYFHPLEA